MINNKFKKIKLLLFFIISIFFTYYLYNFNVAIASTDFVSLKNCSNISSTQEPERRDACFKEAALKNKDLSICNIYINNYENKKDCYYNVINNSDDIDICYEKDSRVNSNCLQNMALRLKDETICAKITDNLSKMKCLSDVAGSLGKTEKCKWLSSYQEDCYIKSAISHKDPKICEHLKYNVRECKTKVAVQNNDINICFSLDEQSSDYCLREMAWKKEDIKICDSISSVNGKNDCYRKFIKHNIPSYILYNIADIILSAKIILVLSIFLLTIIVANSAFVLAQLVHNRKSFRASENRKKIIINLVAFYDYSIFLVLLSIYHLIFHTGLMFPVKTWFILNATLHWLTLPFFIAYFRKHSSYSLMDIFWIYFMYIFFILAFYFFIFLLIIAFLFVLFSLGNGSLYGL